MRRAIGADQQCWSAPAPFRAVHDEVVDAPFNVVTAWALRHKLPVDVVAFGIANRDEIAADERYNLIGHGQFGHIELAVKHPLTVVEVAAVADGEDGSGWMASIES